MRMSKNFYGKYELRISSYLKQQLLDRRMNYAKFSYVLGDPDLEGKERAILQKIGRGKFSAAFLIAAMRALKIEELKLDDILAKTAFDKRRKPKRKRNRTSGMQNKIKKSKFSPGTMDDNDLA